MGMIDSGYVTHVMAQLKALPEDSCKSDIESTRKDLESYNYTPMLTMDVPNFLSATRDDIATFIADAVRTCADDIAPSDLELIVYHYKLLQRLRRNDPESWDHITELMYDD